jgi:lipoprotein signal peptidase
VTQKHRNKTTNNNPKNKKKLHKNRGTLLVIFLVIMILNGILTAVMYHGSASGAERPIIIGLMTLHSLMNIAAAVGIWFWKKWGLYVYAASTILALVLGLVTVGMWSVFSIILPLVILAWILGEKWEYFE